MTELPSSNVLDRIKTLDPDYVEELSSQEWSVHFLQALGRHSFWTLEHSLRVGWIGSKLVERFIDKGKAHVYVELTAGVFHDIGKLAIPVTIIDSNSDQLEWWQKDLLDTHPRIGFTLLKPLDSTAAGIMITHHEYQKDPYPRKFRRDAETYMEEDRVFLALADGVDALSSARPYKPAWPVEKVIDALRKPFEQRHLLTAVDLYREIAN